ncbi:hypothetical protein [Rubritalea tangerina]|uniref:hypothetical protein n=1 Tax=Rubritalea tangerina TaxID=430798 RepID=UPI00361EFA7E
MVTFRITTDDLIEFVNTWRCCHLVKTHACGCRVNTITKGSQLGLRSGRHAELNWTTLHEQDRMVSVLSFWSGSQTKNVSSFDFPHY